MGNVRDYVADLPGRNDDILTLRALAPKIWLEP